MQKVIILSGPSGVGKNTLADILLKEFPQLSYSISATTRSIRQGEENGKDYYFVSMTDFEEKIKNDDLLEWQEVYENTYYGTPKSELDRVHEKNQVPLLVIDVFGAINVMKNLSFKPMSIFIDIVSLEALEDRLTERGTESTEKIAHRMEKATIELQQKNQFDIAIINEYLPIAARQLSAIVKQFLLFG
jgi:guanylate kinase